MSFAGDQLDVSAGGYGTISVSSRDADSEYTSTSDAVDADNLLKSHEFSKQFSE